MRRAWIHRSSTSRITCTVGGAPLYCRIEIVMLPNIDELTVLDEPSDEKMP